MKVFVPIIMLFLLGLSACKNDDCNIEGNCTLIPELEICQTLVVKYYYNQETNECEFYNWCGSPAIFDSMEECEACVCNN